MTSVIINGYDATNYSFVAGEYLVLTKNGVMTGTAPIGGFASNITIDGSITTPGYGLAISQAGPSSGTADQYTRIGANASITTYQISDIYGRIVESLVNAGTIVGVVGMGISVADLSLMNTGVISADGAALSLAVYGTNTVVNAGTLAGNIYGISASGGSVGYGYSPNALNVTNSGTITGGLVALRLGGEPDTILNSGVIAGGVQLGAGNDALDTSTGKVSGVITGGLGDDQIKGSTLGDTIYGDNVNGDTTGGADILYGGFGDDVLNGGYGADALYGNQDNDVLYGNQDNDWMHGGQGDDVLFGGQGDDILNGGLGADTLNGNLGNDTFVFSAAGFGHDRIADLHQAAGDTDVIQLSTDIFGGFADVQAHATAVSNGTLLTDTAGDTILIVGVQPGALTPAMFTFV